MKAVTFFCKHFVISKGKIMKIISLRLNYFLWSARFGIEPAYDPFLVDELAKKNGTFRGDKGFHCRLQTFYHRTGSRRCIKYVCWVNDRIDGMASGNRILAV